MRLSPRETEILRHVAAGHTTKEAAASLKIAESTAEWHMSNVLLELGAASRAEAVAVALREGLLDQEDQHGSAASATDIDMRAEHGASASRQDRVIHFSLLGLHLGDIRIRSVRHGAAETETKSSTSGSRARGGRDR